MYPRTNANERLRHGMGSSQDLEINESRRYTAVGEGANGYPLVSVIKGGPEGELKENGFQQGEVGESGVVGLRREACRSI